MLKNEIKILINARKNEAFVYPEKLDHKSVKGLV